MENLDSAKKQLEREIMEAYIFLRKENMTVPSETLEFMKDAAIRKLYNDTESINFDLLTSLSNIIDYVSIDKGMEGKKLGFSDEMIKRAINDVPGLADGLKAIQTVKDFMQQ